MSQHSDELATVDKRTCSAADLNACPDSRCDWECRLGDIGVLTDMLRHSSARAVLAHADATDDEVAIARRTLGLEVCSEGEHPNDDNHGRPMCRTCEEWHVD